MRPPRIIILVLFFAASLFLFCRSVVSLRSSQAGTPLSSASTPTASSFGSFLSFTTPFTLFPPNAAISLTDDNSTFFPARPAAFGPPLPSRGLSGQLWIGSGFADENLPDGEGEGELGCSDLPGWSDGTSIAGLQGIAIGLNAKGKAPPAAEKDKSTKRSKLPHGPPIDLADDTETRPKKKDDPMDDGTDDYLHRVLRPKTGPGYEMATITSSHADIQSIQETAEITGKVVLLSRGGCGFLEKVKWAQRRGAVTVIVGDNQKGGPLIQMFARGDTSNITIPAIFTSHTTAHLLSSLMQPGSFIEDLIDENGHPTFKVQPADKTRKSKKAVFQKQAPVLDSKVKKESAAAKSNVARMESSTNAAQPSTKKSSWFARIFGFGSSSKATLDRSRPPSSGQHDWVLVNEWSDEKDRAIHNSLEKAAKKGKATSSAAQHISGDGFQIGIQDWRDPDLVDAPGTSADTTSPSSGKASAAGKLTQSNLKATMEKSIKDSGRMDDRTRKANGKGGSITPGSGQYVPQSERDRHSASKPGSQEGVSSGLISKLFGKDDEAGSSGTAPKAANPLLTKQHQTEEPVHEGLWVTISPTGSTAPFFDTLLVLVVSPLITLTVVYALLILRAKLRRRRWRAPRSVVERLPVRTYHTVATSTSPNSRVPSPTSSSPTTPLLQGSSRPRPRSRTTTGVPNADDLLRVDTALEGCRSASRAEEKKPSEWKKYMGRQVECVVCLEEYVDGVSRVMSLPCGHEFHVDCITPWLTTRRRTCPICKGDVVRSLARGSPSSPRYEAYHDDSDDDIEPVASGSGTRSPEQFADVEQGLSSPTPRRAPRLPLRNGGWLGLLSSSFGTQNSLGSSSRPPRALEEDRDR